MGLQPHLTALHRLRMHTLGEHAGLVAAPECKQRTRALDVRGYQPTAIAGALLDRERLIELFERRARIASYKVKIAEVGSDSPNRVAIGNCLGADQRLLVTML